VAIALRRLLSQSLTTVEGFSCCAPATAFWKTAVYVSKSNSIHQWYKLIIVKCVYRAEKSDGQASKCAVHMHYDISKA